MDVSSLAALAGNTLVAAAVTDAWETARERFARLFGRGEPDPATERRLEATRSQLAAAPPDGLEQAQADLARRWALRLADVLEDDPGVEAELRALLDEIGALLPESTVSAAGHSVAAGRDVSIRADRGSVAAGVIHGNVAPPGPTGPGPGSSRPGPVLPAASRQAGSSLTAAVSASASWCTSSLRRRAGRCRWRRGRRCWPAGKNCWPAWVTACPAVPREARPL
jgi:hypothetical protein